MSFPGILISAAMTAGVLLVVYIIAADKKRFLARFSLSRWRDAHYLRRLPNFLQALHDRNFPSAWPRRHNAVAASLFQYRVRELPLSSPPSSRRAFIRQHITLFALLEILHPYIEDFLLNERQRIVSERLVDMPESADRDRLAAYLDSIREHRAAFYRTLTGYDRAVILAMIRRKFIPTLRIAHAVFQEHGYSLIPEFTVLRNWESLTGAELSLEIPKVTPGSAKRLRPTTTLRTYNYGLAAPNDDQS